MVYEYGGVKIEWLGHASVWITNEKINIYIDPYILKPESPKADIILITHDHYDHCSVENIHKLLKEDTDVIATEDCFSKLREVKNFRSVLPGETLEIKNISINTIPAYNLNKPYHTKASNWVGYVITINGVSIYHAGDTDFIPEMHELSVDVALLPVGGTYTMNAEEAAKAVNTFKPKVAIPIHWGSIVGSREDAEKFKKMVQEAEVVIL